MNKYYCDRCGVQIEQKDSVVFVKNTESINIFCRKCSGLFGTCYFCEHSAHCGFEQDPDPMPRFVMIQQRQQAPEGYCIIQRQVPNVERLRKFCLDGNCICCDETDSKNPFCCRHSGFATCGNFKEITFKSRNNIEE